MNNLKRIIKKTFLYQPLKKMFSFWNQLFFKNDFDQIEKDGRVRIPRSIVFEPTTKCNLNCQMCYQKTERALGKKDLTLDEIKLIFKKITDKHKIKNVSMIGAEIFMRPDLIEIIQYFNQLGITTYLATNGTLMSESRVNDLKKLKNITGIGYSIDGPADYHNKIRGASFAFDKLMDAIRLTKNHFNLTTNSVVMTENIEHLPEVADLVSKAGVQNYSLQFEMFSTEKELQDSSKILDLPAEDFAVEIKKTDQYEFSFNLVERIINQIKKIKNLQVLIQPGAYSRFSQDYLEGIMREKHKLCCKDMTSIRINAQGDVIFCPFIKKEFGNLLNQEIDEIWNSEEIKEFRKKLLKNNLTPVCKRCCRLGVR